MTGMANYNYKVSYSCDVARKFENVYASDTNSTVLYDTQVPTYARNFQEGWYQGICRYKCLSSCFQNTYLPTLLEVVQLLCRSTYLSPPHFHFAMRCFYKAGNVDEVNKPALKYIITP